MRSLFRLLAFLLRLTKDVRHSWLRILLVVVLGLCSGPASTAILALINRILGSAAPVSATVLWAFVSLCLVLPLLRFVSQIVLFDLSQNAMLALRLRLSRRVIRAPLRQIEEIGAPRLLAVLADDIGTIIESVALIPVVIMHMSLLVSCLVYLGWLDGRLLLRVSVYLIVSMVVYQLAIRRALFYFHQSRESWNDVIDQVRSVVEGAKELKMHRRRWQAFLRSIETSTRTLLGVQRSGQVIYTAASSTGQTLFYILLGFIVLVMPRIEPLPSKTLVGYTVILFQMLVPLEVFLTSLPLLSRASVAVATVESLGLALDAEPAQPEEAEPLTALTGPLELSGVTYTYRNDANEAFLLGPLDLAFQPGELVFLVGGNGSGKTTLAKLLIGLYAPEQGEIRLMGEPVTEVGMERYRENFAAVFADFFLFETLLGIEGLELDEAARRYLVRLRLDRKVKIEGGAFSTLALSQGERKRLALLTAYLEDRAIYLFDEWAADQDPIFKEIFYLELLPELKRRGKTIFVISHDDHYFHVADRVVKLDRGRIEYDRTPADGHVLGSSVASIWP